MGIWTTQITQWHIYIAWLIQRVPLDRPDNLVGHLDSLNKSVWYLDMGASNHLCEDKLHYKKKDI